MEQVTNNNITWTIRDYNDEKRTNPTNFHHITYVLVLSVILLSRSTSSCFQMKSHHSFINVISVNCSETFLLKLTLVYKNQNYLDKVESYFYISIASQGLINIMKQKFLKVNPNLND